MNNFNFLKNINIYLPLKADIFNIVKNQKKRPVFYNGGIRLFIIILISFFIYIPLNITQAANCTNCPLKGTFFDFDRDYTREVLQREFQQMQQAGFQIIVTLSIGSLEPDGVGGYRLAGAPSLRYQSNLVSADKRPSFDTLDEILTLADNFGMQVYVGSLQTATPLWWNASSSELSALAYWNKKVAEELLTTPKYNNHPSFAGWFFAQESWLNFMRSQGTNYLGYKITQDFINTVKPLDINKKFLVAPVFKKSASGSMPGFGTSTSELAALTNVVKMFVSGTKVNIFAPQDGAGSGAGAPPVSELNLYYQAMQSGVNAAQVGAALWSTVETFQTKSGVPNSQYPPGPISRIKTQISKEKPYVSGMLEWIFTKNMSQRATFYPVESSKLFAQYLSAYSSTIKPVIYPISSYKYNSVQPHPSWPDTNYVELKDGKGGGYQSAATWTGFNTSATENVIITIDLGQNRSIGEIRLLGRSQTDSAIYWPTQVTLFASNDGINFIPVTIAGYQPYPNTQKISYDWIALKPIQTQTARYFRIQLTHSGWLMLAEILPYGAGGSFLNINSENAINEKTIYSIDENSLSNNIDE